MSGATIVKRFPWQCWGCGHHELAHGRGGGPCLDADPSCGCDSFAREGASAGQAGDRRG